MHNIKLFLILFFFVSNSLFADENKSIHISNAWISEAPPNVYILAAYAELKNTSTETQTLVSITSPLFSMIEIHLSKIIDETAKMEKQKSLIIPANDSVEFAPGAYHLMLFSPETPMKAGDTAPMTFIFADGSSKTIEAVVKKRNNHSHDHNHDHKNNH
ncbi:MAG: copper chaperone PCu(A)C [Proteobacteria bacterium]|nr:copper chaperone PCu(A)C [Pseudomonadota bacterium]NOG59515.1 copper chaperone PCu(A)C [Pseudomonadota bacterium]